MNARTLGRLGAALVALAGLATVLTVEPAEAVTQNNLSPQGSIGRIRVRPVFQDRTGATVIQRGDSNAPATNPNRTIGDDVIPLTYNTPGPRFLNNNPFPGGGTHAGHTHYHAGDTEILVNDVTGFEVGDTIMIGSPYCNFPLLGLTCTKFVPGLGVVNEQPDAQIAHVVGGDIPGIGQGILRLASGLVDNPRCNTVAYGPCAILEGSRVAKLPTMYPGQQFRVDIPHVDIVNGSPNDVIVTAEFIPPQGSHDPAYPRRPLALNRDNPLDPDVIVDNACGSVSPPPACGQGFVSFYVPKEITGTQTSGPTFRHDRLTDSWYTIYVKAVDVTNPNVIRADGIVRFKLNSIALVNFKPDRTQATVTQAVTVSGVLRDNTSAPALARIGVEDVIVDVELTKPSGTTSTYQTTTCVDTDPSAADACHSNPFGAPGNYHGAFGVRFGGPQGLFIGFPNVFTSTLNCNAGVFTPTNPATYPNLLNVPACVANPFLAALETLELGTYSVKGTVRGSAPAVTASTSFDIDL